MAPPDGLRHTSTHEFNTTNPPKLDDPVAAEMYLRFFCTVVCGEDGSFRIVDSVEDLHFTGEASPETRASLEEQIVPLTVHVDDAETPAECTIHYSAALFRAKMQIQRTGMVEMLSDDPVAAELPVETTGFWNGIRQTRRGA